MLKKAYLLILIMIMACIFVLLLWFGRVFLLSFQPSYYVVQAQFQDIPQSDEEIRQWLLEQGYPIVIIRRGQNDNMVSFCWGPVGDSKHVSPDLRKVFRQFGYRGLLKYKEDKVYRN